jgi:3-hydroxyisobutyrate dehydrogenase-like beta-hydroxyacid dehydrogenase
MANKLKVGFIGLGLMGNPMAKNILKAGFPLAVYNRSEDKVREFRKIGEVGVYENPKELAENVDVVITMITGPKDVRHVLLGARGVAYAANPGLTVIDMSTIGPTAAQEIAADLENFQIDFLDAPVTGSVAGATSGTLTIFVGGDKKIFEKVKPVLAAMGTNLQYMGLSGSGQAIKMINNMVISIALAGLAEGILLADDMGLSRESVLAALENTPTLSPNMKMKLPLMIKNEFPVAFSLRNMDKDLKLALNEVKNRKSPALTLVEKYFKKGVKEGFGEEDIAVILKTLK